ncbi:MAG: ATP-binding protein [Candidatus Cloacimonetes bacterium]|nr:ATP-binding protein [Candidatus Cloacimonadota bacterium]
MIISFSVENFRSIRNKICLDFRATSDTHLEEHLVMEIPKPKLRILKMAMIYGANASGKTNILLALDFLRNLVVSPQTNKNNPIGLSPFALDTDKNSSFEIEFYHQGVCYVYELVLNNDRILKESLSHYPKGFKANVFHRQYDPAIDRYRYKWTDKSYKKVLRENLQIVIGNQAILAAISGVEDHGAIQKAHEWFRLTQLPIFTPGTALNKYYSANYGNIQKNKDFYLSILQMADFHIRDIIFEELIVLFSHVPDSLKHLFIADFDEIKKGANTHAKRMSFLHEVEDGDFILNAFDESMGTQRFFALSIQLQATLKMNTIISIDEIDNSLHIDLLELFILLFFKHSKESQLIFTSHNVTLLNQKHLLRRDTVFITDRLPDGSTELTNVSDYPVRKEHALDKLFMKGQIGGKPDVGVV